jgi:outer membrane protein insertion porin family
MLKGWIITANVIVSLGGVVTLCAQSESFRENLREVSVIASADGTARGAIVDEVAFTGLRRISPEALKSQVRSHAGDALEATKIEHDVRVLARTGWFETVRAEVQTVGPAENAESSTQYLRLTFYVPELPFLTKVEYRGSRLLSQVQVEKLLARKKLTPKLGEPENPVELNQAARAIETALAELSHPTARVQIVRAESAKATVQVRFEISDGPHVPVGRVTFKGNPAIPEKLLKRQLRRLSPDSVLAGLRGKDTYTAGGFGEDRERLLAYYQNHGYPEARVGAAKAEEYEDVSRRWFPGLRKVENTRLAVAIPIEAGGFYRIDSVTTSTVLEQAAGIDRKEQASPQKSASAQTYSAQGVENLRRMWEARVRAHAKRQNTAAPREVEAMRTMDPVTRTVRIRLDLSAEPAYMVRRLEFRGIHRFPDGYFRKRIGLREGAPLDERALEDGLARLTRTGYFSPIKKENVHIEPNDRARTADVTIRVEELGKQRVSLVGGRGQFGSTLGIAYSLFNILNREELLTSKIEGGPESLQLVVGLAKEGFLGSRGSLALSVFNTFLRPRLSGSVKGSFFRQRSEGITADYNYALTAHDLVTASYGLSYSDTHYSPTASSGANGLVAGDIPAKSSSRSVGLGWTRDTGNQQMVLADSVSGGWLGGSENLVRSKAEYGRIFRDPIFKSENAWAFRTTFRGVGSYSGDMPPTARWYSGDEFVRGLRDGELGPQAIVSSTASGAARYSTSPAGATLIAASNAEYRVRFGDGTEAAGFFDVGSGLLQRNWLGQWKPATIDSANRIVHGSTGIEVRWTLPQVGVPVRAYYAWSVLRLNRCVWMPDGSRLHLRNRLGAFGWGLGSLF